MDIEEEFSLDHLIFKERTCRSCGETKDLMTDYYVIRKNKKYLSSSYSYECKQCTVKRIKENRKLKDSKIGYYPDW